MITVWKLTRGNRVALDHGTLHKPLASRVQGNHVTGLAGPGWRGLNLIISGRMGVPVKDGVAEVGTLREQLVMHIPAHPRRRGTDLPHLVADLRGAERKRVYLKLTN